MNFLKSLPSLRVTGAALSIFLFLLFLAPFAMPIIMAALFAFGLEPLVEKFIRRWKGKRWQFTSLVLVAVVSTILAPMILLIVRAAAILTDERTMASLKEVFNQNIGFGRDAVIAILTRVNGQFGFESGEDAILKQARLIETFASRASSKFLEYLGAWVTQLPEIGFAFLIFVACLFVFLARARLIKAAFLKLDIFDVAEINSTIADLQSSCRTALLSTVIIGCIQASIVSIGSAVIGYGDPWIIFPLAFLTSFIPVVGVAPIALILAAGAGLSGGSGQAIAFVVLALVVGSIDNVMRIYFGADEENLDPVFGLLVILGAIVFIGLPGLFLGPVIANLGAKAFSGLQKK